MLNSPRLRHRDAGSMPLFLLLTIILTSLIAAIVMITLMGLRKSTDGAATVHARAAAEAAVNDALLTFNSQGADGGSTTAGVEEILSTYCPVDDGGTCTGPKTVTLEAVSSDPNAPRPTASWWVERANDPADNIPMVTIHATGSFDLGSHGDTNINLRADLDSTKVSSAYINDAGELVYRAAPDGLARYAVATTGPLMLNGVNVPAYSSDAGSPTIPAVATMDYASVDGVTDPNGGPVLLALWNGVKRPFSDRCAGSACSGVVQLYPHEIEATGREANQFVLDGFNDCGAGPFPAWVASQHTGSLNGAVGPQCFSSMLFDVPTTVIGEATVYVSGPVTVSPGVTVNAGGSDTTPDVTKLKLYVYPNTTGTVETPDARVPVTVGGGPSNLTKVGWMLWAPHSTCGTTDANQSNGGGTYIYGNSLCHTFSVTSGDTTGGGEGWNFHYDAAALREPSPTTATGQFVWTTSNVRPDV